MNSKKTDKSKTIIWAIVVTFLVGIALVGVYQFYLFENPLARSDFAFQLYNPTKTLPGFRLSDNEIDADMPVYYGLKLFWLKPQNVDYDIGVIPVNEGIMEFKNQPKTELGCETQSPNKNICSLHTSTHGQEYEYDAMHSTVPGQENDWSSESVRFVKGNTLIVINISVNDNRLTQQSVLDSFVDSFVPISSRGVKVVHGYPSDAP